MNKVNIPLDDFFMLFPNIIIAFAAEFNFNLTLWILSQYIAFIIYFQVFIDPQFFSLLIQFESKPVLTRVKLKKAIFFEDL